MIFKKIKTKIKEKEYLNYITEHKSNVHDALVEMVMCEELAYLWEDENFYNKMIDRIVDHDKSKFEAEEFNAYRKYFYPINEEEKELAKEEFEKAWQHHLENNDHHWQHRTNAVEFTEETQLAILENVCDWLAMGYKFDNRPYNYYEKNKKEIILPEKDKKFLEMVIYALEKNCKAMTYNYGKRK